ncbi:MAG TPA: DUF938 domain-containing protein [Ferrovibrio sp.]|jgi:hypothetical protein|uniref:DUF938 domain-containing protein n=1 Tax=Ferrovibrio sp. TaxID=1917215 RepID=UPI002ED5150D
MPGLRHAPATLRNREPILLALQRILPPATDAAPRLLLEIASGTGEHAAFMAPRLPGWIWQPSDYDADALADIDGHARESGCDRIRPAIRLDVQAPAWPLEAADAILCCNMIHIAPWSAAEGLMAGAARLLGPGAPLVLYGPFKRHGAHTAPSNAKFDAEFLRARNPDWGVRCLDTEVQPLAERCGLALAEVMEMPANNMVVVGRRS